MSTFLLKIVTPDGLQFEGQAQSLIVRATTGDVEIMARHMDFVAPLGMGLATVVDADGNRREAACMGGMLSMVQGEANLVPTTFEWADKIDSDRAEKSLQRAQKVLQSKSASDTDLRLAEARLKRALVRKSVASSRKF